MLIIRDDQRSAMRQAREQVFVELMVAHLQRLRPEQAQRKGIQVVRQAVTAGLTLGKELGVSSGAERSHLIELVFDLGARPESWPEAADVLAWLEDPGLSGDAKVRMIREHLDDVTGGREIVLFSPRESQP